jgi:hypothetical protein
VDGDDSGPSWRHAHFSRDFGFRVHESLIAGGVGVRFPLPGTTGVRPGGRSAPAVSLLADRSSSERE